MLFGPFRLGTFISIENNFGFMFRQFRNYIYVVHCGKFCLALTYLTQHFWEWQQLYETYTAGALTELSSESQSLSSKRVTARTTCYRLYGIFYWKHDPIITRIEASKHSCVTPVYIQPATGRKPWHRVMSGVSSALHGIDVDSSAARCRTNKEEVTGPLGSIPASTSTISFKDGLLSSF